MYGLKFRLIVPVVCFVLLLVPETETREIRRNRVRRPSTENRDVTKPWDYLAFTQQWPPATCIQAEEAQNGKRCLQDVNFNIWTIHGLWPNAYRSSGVKDPENCESPQNFKVSNISSIEQQLRKKWPTYFSFNPTSFWKYEWVKHGSCANDHPSLNTLFKYFKKGLELHDQYNMYSILKQVGYLPNQDKTIKAADVQNRLNEALGKTVLIKCAPTRVLPRPMLTSVIICFDKSLQITDCADRKSSCYGDIFYWPI